MLKESKLSYTTLKYLGFARDIWKIINVLPKKKKGILSIWTTLNPRNPIDTFIILYSSTAFVLHVYIKLVLVLNDLCT